MIRLRNYYVPGVHYGYAVEANDGPFDLDPCIPDRPTIIGVSEFLDPASATVYIRLNESVYCRFLGPWRSAPDSIIAERPATAEDMAGHI